MEVIPKRLFYLSLQGNKIGQKKVEELLQFQKKREEISEVPFELVLSGE